MREHLYPGCHRNSQVPSQQECHRLARLLERMQRPRTYCLYNAKDIWQLVMCPPDMPVPSALALLQGHAASRAVPEKLQDMCARLCDLPGNTASLPATWCKMLHERGYLQELLSVDASVQSGLGKEVQRHLRIGRVIEQTNSSGDGSIELSEPMRVELLLELSGLSRQEIIVTKACAPDANPSSL